MKRILTNGQILVSKVKYLGSHLKAYRSQITLDGFIISSCDYSHYATNKNTARNRAYRVGRSIVQSFSG